MNSPSPRTIAAASVVSAARSARNARTAAAESRDQRFLDTLLNNMSQPVLMFDADTRLIFCRNLRDMVVSALAASGMPSTAA